VASEGSFAGEHLVKNRPQCKNVRPLINLLPPHLLGRHIADSAHDYSGQGTATSRLCLCRFSKFLRTSQFRQPKIKNLEPPAAGDEKILRLQISVDNPLLVRSV